MQYIIYTHKYLNQSCLHKINLLWDLCITTACVLCFDPKKIIIQGGKKQTTLCAWPCLFSSNFCISSLMLHTSLLILDIPPVLIWTSKSYSYPKYQQSEILASLLIVIYNLKRSLISCLQEILPIKNKTYMCSHEFL